MNAAVDLEPVSPGLQGVPETMLLTIWTRSAYSDGKHSLLDDPLLMALMKRIDYDFRGRFGAPSPVHAVRSRYADERIRDFLGRHHDGTVIVLGEGLETQFWRVDDRRVQWYTVDLPESIAIRKRLLPAHERNHLIACSALDDQWLEQIAGQVSGPVFISAAGLLMYFTEAQVQTLLEKITGRFGQGEVFFDTIPPWFSRKTLKGWKLSPSYTAPRMPFGMPLARIKPFVEQVNGLRLLSAPTFAQPYPQYMRLFALLSRLPYARNNLAPGLVHCAFGQRA
jgi:O-methyltransferase involved in polyketide biosynthesis